MWPAAERCLGAYDVQPQDDDGHTFNLTNSRFSCQSDRRGLVRRQRGAVGGRCKSDFTSCAFKLV